MACKIADNPALEALRVHLEAEKHCHSQRIDCIHRLPRAETPSYYGVSGAFMGYCQALFHKRGALTENTLHITELLTDADLPWARSHELFIGHRGTESIQQFVEGAARPLTHLGRVPILITGIDVTNGDAINEILTSPIDVVDGETVLVRLVADSQDAIRAVGPLLTGLIEQAEQTGKMPQWWPLIQAGGKAAHWLALKSELGVNWRYLNVAVNPFIDAATYEVVADQIMVAQFVVPADIDISPDGAVRIGEEMRIYGAKTGDKYSIPEFAERISHLDTWPTCIFLGPTHPEWSDAENVNRVSKAVNAFICQVRGQWERDGMTRYEPLWKMAA